MAAERAYETYNYTFDPERRPQGMPKTQGENKVNVVYEGKAKKNMIIGAVAIGLFFILMVIFTAFASNLAYANNQMQKENEDLANEVQSLKVDIKSAMNIGTIESAASGQLGMIYPTGTQFVQIENGGGVENFAETLKKEAFN